MSNSAITPLRRAFGWNLVFLAGSDGEKFAGVFHPPGSSTLTYRHIVQEFRLCFDIPSAQSGMSNAWDDIAFFPAGVQGGYMRPLEDTAPPPSGRLISGSSLDTPVVTLPFDPNPQVMSNPSVIRMHVVRHVDCNLNLSEPFEVHIRGGCAQHISIPSVRRDPRYLPPNKPSRDPRFAQLPYRKTIRATRGSQSPSKSPKRSASGSASPTKEVPEGTDADVTNLVTPPGFDMDVDNAKQKMASFRSLCLTSNFTCAVTGQGRSWFGNSDIGPAVQACHIVSQQHYHTYPTPGDLTTDDIYSPQRLRAAWQSTWSAKNGILLLSHLHELFDARLLSIHPETLRIRVFVPYDVILEYHGKLAQISWEVDRKALRHHYDMCCFENMTAHMPLSEELFGSQPATPSIKSGAISPFESGPHIPNITSEKVVDGNAQDLRGDPAKKPKSRRDEPQKTGHLSADIVSLTTDDSSAISSARHQPTSPGSLTNKRGIYVLDEIEETGTKRRRILNQGGAEACDYDSESEFQIQDPYWDGCLTPCNSLTFLSDVDWKLRKMLV